MTRGSSVVMMFVVVCCGTGLAQLSDSDIALLEARGKAEGWTFSVGKNPATQRPLKELCGLVVPENWREGARFTNFAAKDDLPASLDWRVETGCPPVQSQGSCGSCWAFATVGVLECNILIKDGVTVNLSEQWLINCNQEEDVPVLLGGAWGCDGGWWAHSYHQGEMTDPCGGAGAVLEGDCWYVGYDAPCDCPYPHAYGIDSWAFVGPEEDVAPVEAIKQAIVDFGPVSVGMYANAAFSAYTGGVFNASELVEPNHALVLVGWDDNQGTSGVWFLRNSWGEFWGEDGYMRVEYGCSNVGYGATYIDYAGYGEGIGPDITAHPADGTIIEGWPHTLAVAASGIGELQYEWTRNGDPVGGDSPSCTIANPSAADEGIYVCTISDVRGTSVSVGAELVLDTSIQVPAAGAAALALLAVACVLLLARRARTIRSG